MFKTVQFRHAHYLGLFALALAPGLSRETFAAENPDLIAITDKSVWESPMDRLAAAPSGNTISSQPAGANAVSAGSESSDLENPPSLSCKVDSMVFASKVEDKMPEGMGTSFPPGLVYCWSRIHCSTAPGTLKHVWTQGKNQREIALRMSSTSGRVWSQKQVTPGTWKVDVMTSDGEIAGSATIEVK
jgi:Protein of unknown function (DUF2914)